MTRRHSSIAVTAIALSVTVLHGPTPGLAQEGLEARQTASPGAAQEAEVSDVEVSDATATALSALLIEAEENNPGIRAAERSAEAARARVPQAGALPDPKLGLGVMNFPVSDPGFGRDRMTMARVQLSETFPWPGKLGLREDVARLRAKAAEWEAERARQDVLAEVKAAYYEVYFQDRALEVTARNEKLLGDLARLTSAQYSVGTGAQPDVLKAQVERTRLSEQRVALEERRAATVARLNALLGRPPEAPLPATKLPVEVRAAALEQGGSSRGPRFTSSALEELRVPSTEGGSGIPGIPGRADLRRLALANSPTIRAHVARVAAQERALALSETAPLPDFDVSVGYSHRSDFGDFVDFMVSVPLPVFSGRKQDQQVIEETAVLEEHRARHHEMVDAIDAEIESILAGLRRTRRQLVLLDDGVLPQARASLASATGSYRVGKVDFLTLLDAQVTLYQHELDAHQLLAEFAGELAKLEQAVGTEVLR